MKTVTIGIRRDDGDVRVLATLNNNDGELTQAIFNWVVECLLAQYKRELPNVELFERQDSPDYVDSEEDTEQARSMERVQFGG